MRIYPTKSSGQVGNEKMGRPPARRERINGVNGRYKGVRMRKWGKWVAEVRQPNSRDRIWLGSYDTAEEAGRAYDAAVFCLRGPTAMLNFPWDPPQIPSADELNPVQIQAAASRHARKESQEANTSKPQEVAGTTSSELNNPVTNSTTELNDPAINLTDCGDCYSVRHGGGGGEGVDNLVAGGTFYETPRVWSF